MLENSKYKILRFDIFAQITKSKNEEKLNKLRYQYAHEFTQFKIKLIDEFCSVTFKGIELLYETKRYSKSHIFGTFDIGLDMIKEESGLLQENHWMYVYYKIPIENKKMIDFFDKQVFSFNVKLVKRI